MTLTHCARLLVITALTMLVNAPIHAQDRATELSAHRWLNDLEAWGQSSQLGEVANTLDPAHIAFYLGDLRFHFDSLAQRRWAALATALGVIDLKDINVGLAGNSAFHTATFDPMFTHKTLSTPPKALVSAADGLVLKGLITGYNLLPAAKQASDALSLRYGHSDPLHAYQLAALLNTRQIAAELSLQPKLSAFVVRNEWKAIEGQGAEDISLINRGEEYDLNVIFAHQHERDAFVALFQQFAKRDSQHETGLLKGAWWQPFVRSDVPIDGFYPLSRVQIRQGQWQVVTLVAKSHVDAVLAAIEKGPNSHVSEQQVWVNPAFYRYIQGHGV